MVELRVRHRFPARPDSAAFALEIEFRAGSGGLHSAEN